MNQTIELTIRGMDCADCARHVEERIGNLAGVASVQVYLTAERGVVTYDAKQVDPSAFTRAIHELGYRVQTPDVPRESPARQRMFALANMARLGFVAAIAVLALTGLLVERLGILDRVVEQIPTPLVLLAILVGGLPIFKSAWLGVRARQINADLLMTVGISAATVLGEFVSAALIVFFMSVAHVLENITTEKSRAAIRHLLALAPTTAHVLRDGVEIETPVEALRVEDCVVVRPGERLPADGVVIGGASAVDQSPITGESMPVAKSVGDPLFAGSVNQRGVMQVRVTRIGRDSMLGKIVRLVEEAEATKAPVQKFADRYSALYLPVVIGAALLTFIFTRNPVNAIAVLVVACPCAIALATPLAVVAGVGRAASRGILIKGGLYLEMLAQVDTLVMDKTGTLTFGRPRVTDIEIFDFRFSISDLEKSKIENQKSKIVQLAAMAEKYSEHPLASAILDEAHARGISVAAPDSFEVIAGQGVVARLNGDEIVFGNRRLMETRGIAFDASLAQHAHDLEQAGKTVMYLTSIPLHPPSPSPDCSSSGEGEGSGGLGVRRVSGLIAVADVVRDQVPRALEELKQIGIRRLIVLTGDNARVASAMAERLGVEYRAEMLPEDKIGFVRELQAAGHRVAMIGDGINDAPALAQADVGIAMGVAGTDVAMDAAHVALMTDDWNQIPSAIKLARRTFRTIQQNIAFGLFFNVAGLSLASLGILTPVMAAAAQSLPDVAVFLNSSRLLRAKT